jgi:hypothetical protein
VQVAKLPAVNHRGKLAVQGHQALVCAEFHNAAFREKQHKICVFRGSKVMSDEQGRGIFAKAAQGS